LAGLPSQKGRLVLCLHPQKYTVLDSIGNLPGFGGLSGIGYALHFFVTATIRYTLSVWRKQLPDCRGSKTGFLNQCHQFNAKLVHFIGRLGTVPAGTDFREFSGKKSTESGDQKETRDDPDYVCAPRDDFGPGGAKHIEGLAQSIDKQPELGWGSRQGASIAAMFHKEMREGSDERCMGCKVV